MTSGCRHNRCVNDDSSRRFGINFWPEMRNLCPPKAGRFRSQDIQIGRNNTHDSVFLQKIPSVNNEIPQTLCVIPDR
ncbi:unnamed protein product [Mesocestoides corti]|uniref:Uncharacterized protein n=1 Tax=Mesocestoides corti TaxID=53468 RepID=A0A0R3UAA1_MESCO|nr:unnamed protein product [Mesocestoides corti]